MTSAPAPTRDPRVTTLDVEQIARLLPHRYPFALLDRVTECVPGEYAVAVKNVSVSDGLLAGHFPDRRIYPGVLLVECIAQLAAVVYGAQAALDGGDDVADRVGYLAEIKQAKFLGVVTPGDSVVLRVRAGSRLGELISVAGQASVGSTVVMTAKLTVTQHAAGA